MFFHFLLLYNSAPPHFGGKYNTFNSTIFILELQLLCTLRILIQNMNLLLWTIIFQVMYLISNATKISRYWSSEKRWILDLMISLSLTVTYNTEQVIIYMSCFQNVNPCCLSRISPCMFWFYSFTLNLFCTFLCAWCERLKQRLSTKDKKW